MNDTPAPVAETPAAAPAPEATPAVAESQSTPVPSAREALDRAFDTVTRGDEPSESLLDPKPEAQGSPERPRDESGRFVSKTPQEAAVDAPQAQETAKAIVPDAPAWLNAEKQAWAAAPEPLKAEINRRVAEIEGGLEQYRKEFEPLKPWADLAKRSNTTIPEALERYVAIDQLLTNDPVKGLEQVFKAARIDPRQYAAHILGQPADKVQAEQYQVVTALQNEIAALKQQLGNVSQTIEQQREAEAIRQVEAFAQKNPRLEELWPVMEKLMAAELVSDPQAAYNEAEKLVPSQVSSAAKPAPARTQAANPAPQKGQFSVTGAPGSGSNPRPKAPSTARAALDDAFASVGIG